jgi:hypothetical protein
MKLRVFAPKEYLRDGLQAVPLLDPFCESPRYDPEANWALTSDEYCRRAPEWFEIVRSETEADVAVFPVDWDEVLRGRVGAGDAERFLRRAKSAGIPALIFFCTDAPLEVDWPDHAVVLRIAISRSKRKPMERIIPQWSRDYFATVFGRELRVREWREKPVIGFCGFAPPLGLAAGKRRAKEIVRLWAHRCGLWRFFSSRMAHAARARALMRLARSPGIETNFRIRPESAFDNPIGAFLPGGTVEAADVRRREFAENIAGSDYVLCARGWANCSIRFYEALSLGRIPVLIDTDCALPWEREIDWEQHCVRVPERDLKRVGERVLEFHRRHDPASFGERQRACRRLYEEWLSPEGFFGNLHRLVGGSNPGDLAVAKSVSQPSRLCSSRPTAGTSGTPSGSARLKLLFATSCLAEGKDGVGDYTRMLAEACGRRGFDTLLVALNDPFVQGVLDRENEIRLGAGTPWKERVRLAAGRVRTFSPDRVSLQFVCYGFHPRGIDFALPQRLRDSFGGRIDHLMFHELWVGEGDGSGLKTRLLGMLQRRMIGRILDGLRPTVIHTSNGCYAARLKAAGALAEILPLFGAIPLVGSPDEPERAFGADGMFRGGIFGTLHPVWPPEPLLARLMGLPGRIVIEHAGRIGDGERLWRELERRYAGRIEWIRRGEMSPEQLAAWHGTLDFGVATTPWDIIGKSASAAAMLEHGLPVVVNRDDVHFKGWREPGSQRLILAGDDLVERLKRCGRGTAESRLESVTDRFLESLDAPRSNR